MFEPILYISLSFIFIFVLHYLYNFFKNNLTTPQVKDLVNKPRELYTEIYKDLNTTNKPFRDEKSNYNNDDKEINNDDKSHMKEELKSYLKQIKKSNTNNDIDKSNSNNIIYNNNSFIDNGNLEPYNYL
jgi:hypothetical protein